MLGYKRALVAWRLVYWGRQTEEITPFTYDAENGEFSKICEVSTKTLRYYDEIGLLVPTEANPESGYRYYSIEQLKTMLFINRLKSQHFSLEERHIAPRRISCF